MILVNCQKAKEKNSYYFVCSIDELQIASEYKSSIPHFVFHQSQLVICLLFSILNFGYFIKKVKQIHGKLVQRICTLYGYEKKTKRSKYYHVMADSKSQILNLG